MGFFAAPLIVAILTAILAAIITVVDSIVNNYGEVELDINEGSKKIKVDGGNPLLTTLSEQGIFIPSACGGRGSCGACKVKVLSDIGPILPTEAPLLEEDEKKDGIRLSCQIKVKEDIKIEIPEELFNVKEFKTKIESIKEMTHDIKEVRLELLEPDSVNFKAGKYAQLIIPKYGKIKEETQRAYSISSVPSDKSHLEFLIRLVPGGIATTYVHEHLEEGQNLKIVGPFGDFYRRDTDATMVCVAGGSGMAPIKSIIEDMYEKEIFDREIWYFFGARSKKDLYYVEYFEEMEKKMKNLHFIPALSDPEPEDKWEGETGLITDVLDKYLKNQIDNEKEKEGYLCGSPGMLNACISVMKGNQMKEDKIYYDKFA